MRVALLLTALLLAGCSLFKKPDDAPLPKQPDAPTTPSVVHSLGKDLDKTDHRVASALVAIERNADKPKVVVAESRLAQSYLPQPPEADVAFAIARASRAETPQGALDYAKQMEFGRKLATAVNRAWEKLEADQAEAKRVSGLKDRRIEDLEKQLIDKDRAWESKMWTALGAALVIFGGFIGWLAKSPKGAAIFIGLGFACGAYPRVVESPWFDWVVGGASALCALIGLFMLWQRYRNNPRKSAEVNPAQSPHDDEQAPPQV